MNGNKSFEIIRVLITSFVVLAFVAIAVSAFGGACGLNKKYADRNAERFIIQLGLDVKGVQCNGNDTDNDGYVSCTFAMADGSIKQFECAGWSYINEGCREPKLNIQNRGSNNK